MTSKRLVKLLIPTPAQLVVCLLLAAVVEFLVFQSLFLPKLLMWAGIDSYIVPGRQLGLAQLNQFSIVRLAVQGLFWSIVGICAYIIYLGLTNAALDARNEVVVDTEYANQGTWSRRLTSVGVQLILAAGLIVAAWLTANVGLPLWFDLMGNLVVGGYSWAGVGLGIVSILGFSLNIYLLWILGEAAITADRW